jgi:hypothetical protein
VGVARPAAAASAGPASATCVLLAAAGGGPRGQGEPALETRPVAAGTFERRVGADEQFEIRSAVFAVVVVDWHDRILSARAAPIKGP